MKIQQFLEHHGIESNPFSDEDAQSDHVFKEHCIDTTYHVAWDKIYGNPADPATSIVFGEKGAGKTALRLQLARRISEYNRGHAEQRAFVVEYDDFNPFLDRFRDMLGGKGRRSEKVLAYWKLWDHMDAMLALAVTRLVDSILGSRIHGPHDVGAEQELPIDRLDRWQKRDLLVLAAIYDRSPSETFKSRWHRLRRKLGFRTWKSLWDLGVGVLVTAAVLITIAATGNWNWLATIWPYLMIAAGWLPRGIRFMRAHLKAGRINRHVRVIGHDKAGLRHALMNFMGDEINAQPLPDKQRTDDRYEQLFKLQSILETLGYKSIIVLVDRVDEPHLVNGQPEAMRALLWPLLDNKLLKQPGMGLKLLLPVELSHYIEREDREFYQRARLDKQNMVPSLNWTGQALYDVANARLGVCANNGSAKTLKGLFGESVSEQRLIDSLRQLRTPRHLFKFMHRLLVAHCNAHTEENPVFEIDSSLFESTLALYLRDQDAFDRGMGPG